MTVSFRLPTRVALWLLDHQRLGKTAGAKRIAGRLLKQPALEGEVVAQSRLGQLLCCECETQRDRRIGLQLLRLAARAGDCQAQLELGRLHCRPNHYEPGQARHWLQAAATRGSKEARQLLKALPAR
ncbi:sel1 repeat family protein [Stutzerimonas tarimensis]|uniref:Sel1 repeat family protein n=1 Tax=Stutzerimonas tarimensis TaxID=1507735 RepID=A0ABV7T3G3_9GAMM